MKIALLSYCILPVVAVINLPGCNSTISTSMSTSRINVAATVSLDFDTLLSNGKITVLFPNSSTNVYQLPTELQPPSITSNLESFPTFRPDPTGLSLTTRLNFTRSFSIISANTTGRSRSIEQHKSGTSLTKVCLCALNRATANGLSSLDPCWRPYHIFAIRYPKPI